MSPGHLSSPRAATVDASTTVVYLTQTCGACPDQWEGETGDGRRLYLRHRHGEGRLSIGRTPDEAVDAGWRGPGRTLLAWYDDEWDGQLRPGALPHIFYLAGLDLTPEAKASITTRPDADDFIAAAAELGISLAELRA